MSLLELSVGLFMHLAVPPQLFAITFAVLGVLKPSEAACFPCTKGNCAALPFFYILNLVGGVALLRSAQHATTPLAGFVVPYPA